MDTSYEGIKAVTTPAFQMSGIYYIEASYAVHGIAKVGLIYDTKRKREIVDDFEFILDTDDDVVSYRINVSEESPVRFKVRLTEEAEEGDYILLTQVHVISSELTYIFRIFCMAAFFLFLDLLLWGYFRHYRKWKTTQKIIFMTLGVIAFLIGIPFYRKGLPDVPASDVVFHLNRIRGICEGLLSGQFPVRIQPGWMGGYGYASSVFYGDIFLYFPAVIYMAGFALQDAYKCYVVIVNFATVFVSFYAFRKMSKNDIAATAASILYTGSIGRLYILCYEAMIGGYSAMIFYPLIIAGFYLIFTEDEQSGEYKKNWMLLTLGFTGLLLTHMISCLMAGLYAVLCCVVMIKKVFRKNTFLELIKAVGVAFLLNLWFLVPFVQYMLFEKLSITSDLGQTMKITDYASYLSSFTHSGKDIYSLFMDTNSIGYALLGVLLLYIVLIPVQGKDKLTEYSRIIFGFAVFSVLVCMNFFPVIKIAQISNVFVKYFSTIQYQYRFISLAIALVSCLGVIFFSMEIFNRKICFMIVGLLCCITLYQDFCYFETLDSEIYLEDVKKLSYSIGYGEYLPVVTNKINLTKEIEYDEALQIHDIERRYLTFDISAVNPTEQEQQILLPVLYYSGYKAFDSQDKVELETFQGDNGRVAVSVPAGYNSIFHMAYYEPWFWRVSEIVSLVTLLFILYYIFKGKEYSSIWKLKKLQTKHSENTAG